MTSIQQQKGIGLIEVLVSLLILAIGVLGFMILQYRAIEATSEGGNRIQAIGLARDLAEKIRVNREAYTQYVETASRSNISELPKPNCFNTWCNANQKAVFDSSFIKLQAQRQGMTLNMFTCPNILNQRQCIYVAWGETAATVGDNFDDCTSSQGNYNKTSTCIVMEVY